MIEDIWTMNDPQPHKPSSNDQPLKQSTKTHSGAPWDLFNLNQLLLKLLNLLKYPTTMATASS